MYEAANAEEIVRTARIDEGADAGGNDRQAKIIWAAGFFDGEGCIGIYPARGGGSFQLTAQVGQVDPRPLKILCSLFGGRVYEENGESRKKEHRRQTKWLVSCNVASSALLEMLPYLQVKAEEARLAVEFQALKQLPTERDDHGRQLPLSPERFTQQRIVAEDIKKLKRRLWR